MYWSKPLENVQNGSFIRQRFFECALMHGYLDDEVSVMTTVNRYYISPQREIKPKFYTTIIARGIGSPIMGQQEIAHLHGSLERPLPIV